jgi:hypothetical protein
MTGVDWADPNALAIELYRRPITIGTRSIVVLLAASLAPSDARTAATGRRSR